MKIYTKTGDGGFSSLFGGKRLLKSDLRLEAYGTIDELNAVLGLALTLADGQEQSDTIKKIQSDLFNIGAELALGDDQELKTTKVGEKETNLLEQYMDVMQAELPELKNFILPGGTSFAAALHQARTVARRAERAVVRLKSQIDVRPEIMAYLNRLSDYLFVLARYANFRAQAHETIWKG